MIVTIGVMVGLGVIVGVGVTVGMGVIVGVFGIPLNSSNDALVATLT